MIYQWFTGEYDSDAVVVVLIENQTVKHLIPDCTIVDSYFGREQDTDTYHSLVSVAKFV